MKFNMIIGGVETIFPEADARYFKEKNKIVIYFLKLNKKYLEKTKKNIRKATLRKEDDYLVLLLNDFQYAFNLDGYDDLLELYSNGSGLAFAFEDEQGMLLDIATPTFHNV